MWGDFRRIPHPRSCGGGISVSGSKPARWRRKPRMVPTRCAVLSGSFEHGASAQCRANSVVIGPRCPCWSRNRPKSSRILPFETAAKSAPEFQVVLHLVFKVRTHETTSGHGIATSRRESKSSLAYTWVVARQRCPIRSATSFRLAPLRMRRVANVWRKRFGPCVEDTTPAFFMTDAMESLTVRSDAGSPIRPW